MSVNVFDSFCAQSLPWKNFRGCPSRMNYLQALLKFGPNHYIDNVHTSMMAAQVDEQILPFTICHDDCESSYVTSLYNQYIGYARDELQRHVSPGMRGIYDSLLVVLGELLKAGGVNRCIHVNNWLFSTNLTPEMNRKQLKALVEALIERYPKDAIVFRSVNGWHYDSIHQFVSTGFSPMFSRQIYMLDAKTEAPFKERHFKKDLKLLEESGYEVISPSELSIADSQRIAELYRSLNIDKYSRQNPQFNSNFTEMAIKNQALRFSCLKKEGRIDGVYGCYDDGEVMVAPFFGYDTTLPEELGLYRQISALAVLEARDKGLVLNQSSGASSFKLRRKAVPVLEYHMAYTRHLNPFRQAAWKAMCKYGNSVILPFVLKNNI